MSLSSNLITSHTETVTLDIGPAGRGPKFSVLLEAVASDEAPHHRYLGVLRIGLTEFHVDCIAVETKDFTRAKDPVFQSVLDTYQVLNDDTPATVTLPHLPDQHYVILIYPFAW